MSTSTEKPGAAAASAVANKSKSKAASKPSTAPAEPATSADSTTPADSSKPATSPGMTVLQRLVGKFQRKQADLRDRDAERQRSAATAFEQLVETLADGADVDDEHIESVVKEAGKTVEDLLTATELKIKRREARAVLDRRPMLQAEYSDLNRERQAAVDKVNSTPPQMRRTAHLRMLMEFEDAQQTNMDRLLEINRQLMECDEAERFLFKTSPHRQQQAKLAELTRPLREKIRFCNHQLRVHPGFEGKLASLKPKEAQWKKYLETGRRCTDGSIPPNIIELVEQMQCVVDRLRGQVKPAQAKLEQLNRQEAELTKLIYQP